MFLSNLDEVKIGGGSTKISEPILNETADGGQKFPPPDPLPFCPPD